MYRQYYPTPLCGVIIRFHLFPPCRPCSIGVLPGVFISLNPAGGEKAGANHGYVHRYPRVGGWETKSLWAGRLGEILVIKIQHPP